MSTTSTSTSTTSTTTTNGSPPPAPASAEPMTVSLTDLAGAFAALRRVGKARPVTVHPYPARGIIALAVRVTPSDPDAGSVYVTIPAVSIPDSGPWIMAAGVLDIPAPVSAMSWTPFERLEDGGTVIGGVAVADSPGLSGFAALPPGLGDLSADRADRSWVEIPAATFSLVAARVSAVASKDRTRPVLTGVLLDYSTAGALMIAATDSYRMVLESIPVRTNPGQTIITPAAALARAGKEAGRKGKGRPHWANVSHHPGNGGWTTFEVGDVMVTAPDIDGQYPDHRQLIPATFDTVVTIDREGIAAALESVAVRMKVADPGGKDYPVVLSTVSPIAGQVAATAPNGGPTITATFPMSGGDIIPMGLNPTFLAALVAAMQGAETFTLGVISPLRAILATSAAGGPRVLLMPIRLPA